MRVPKDFTTRIAATFYDKEVSVYASTEEVGQFGSKRIIAAPTEETFMANVQYSKLDQIAKEYGLTEGIDVRITCAVGVPLHTIIGYDNRQYKVVQSIPFDTHVMLLGKLWLSRSSTLISA